MALYSVRHCTRHCTLCGTALGTVLCVALHSALYSVRHCTLHSMSALTCITVLCITVLFSKAGHLGRECVYRDKSRHSYSVNVWESDVLGKHHPDYIQHSMSAVPCTSVCIQATAHTAIGIAPHPFQFIATAFTGSTAALPTAIATAFTGSTAALPTAIVTAFTGSAAAICSVALLPFDLSTPVVQLCGVAEGADGLGLGGRQAGSRALRFTSGGRDSLQRVLVDFG